MVVWRCLMAHRRILIALFCSLCLLGIFPARSLAHAILLRSDPAKDALLRVAPGQVRMWFSEAVNPAFSTAAVVNTANQRVDQRDALVAPDNAEEMVVTLAPNLPAGVYVVLWRTDSADDGHILRGSFLFTIERADGTVPHLGVGPLPGSDVLGGNGGTQAPDALDATILLTSTSITLLDLGAIFWIGAALWLLVLFPRSDIEQQGQQGVSQQVHIRYARRMALPAVLVVLFANSAILLEQAAALGNGSLASMFSPTLLWSLITQGRFGLFWFLRELLVLLALQLALFAFQQPLGSRRESAWLNGTNLLLGVAFFVAVALSSHAAAVNGSLVLYALTGDFLHLLAATLWVGGMLFLALVYLPVLRTHSLSERACSLKEVLPKYSPWAITGVLLMAVTGPFSATVHLSSFGQLFSTAYGQALVVKVLLVGALLATSALHVLRLRPAMVEAQKQYDQVVARLGETEELSDHTSVGAEEMKVAEQRLQRRTHRLTQVLRYEPVLGVAVLVCVGLMNVFAGTLVPAAPANTPSSQTTSSVKPFTTTAKTTDGQFLVSLEVTPDQFGPNTFIVSVLSGKTGTPTTNVGVSLYTTQLDMDMGTDTVNLQPDGKGHFQANGDLVMPGHWGIRIVVRTLDNTLHEATVTLVTATETGARDPMLRGDGRVGSMNLIRFERSDVRREA